MPSSPTPITGLGKTAKGRRLTVADVDRLLAEGVDTVIACRLDPGDLTEDEAAEHLSAAIPRRVSPASGLDRRVNFYAGHNGLFLADKSLSIGSTAWIQQSRLPVSPTVPMCVRAISSPPSRLFRLPWPVAVSRQPSSSAVAAFQVAAYRPRRVYLIATQLPSLKTSVMDKTARVLEARLASSRSRIVSEQRVVHQAVAVAEAIRLP